MEPYDDVTTAVHRIVVEPNPSARPPRVARPLSPPAPARRAVPRNLAKTLLPGERVTFGSTPHPVVIVRPLLLVLAVLVGFAVAWQTVSPRFHVVVEVLGALAALASLVALGRGVGYFLGFRAVATNRRIFVIRGILWRRMIPLGNGALAASTLVQGVFGRIYGFGTVDVPQPDARRPLFRDMRDPGELYRECQAVANGVEGDEWKPAVRQTIIP
jgi:hypothetical protein